MGMYIYVTEEDRVTKRQVADKELNDEFQEALKVCPSLMIEKSPHPYVIERTWYGKPKFWEDIYNIYHETPAFDGSPYQARAQWSGSGNRRIVIAYLHGIINGYHARAEEERKTWKQPNH